MTKLPFAAATLVYVTLAAHAAPANDPKFPMQDGKSIYEHVCQGCHMPGGKGAVGAGAYPALAQNPKLEEGGYPAAIIIQGQKAMPSFGAFFSDNQVAEVVNYIRTHFGNHYSGRVTAAEVKLMR